MRLAFGALAFGGRRMESLLLIFVEDFRRASRHKHSYLDKPSDDTESASFGTPCIVSHDVLSDRRTGDSEHAKMREFVVE
jgi:hypothetical protein